MKIFNKVYYILLSVLILIIFGILTFQFIFNVFYDGSFNINETVIILLLAVILQNLIEKDKRKE